MSTSRLYGLLVEFTAPWQLLDAARRVRLAGYRRFDAFSPYPVEGLAIELGHKKSVIPRLVLAGGLAGTFAGFAMQYYSMVFDYRFNSGGKPFNSWPAFIPITFELLVLVASFTAVIAFLFLNGLPRLHHPLFDVPQFARAGQDRFFLCIEADDPLFDRVATQTFLATLAGEVWEVPESE
jgi:hypothetical protein